MAVVFRPPRDLYPTTEDTFLPACIPTRVWNVIYSIRSLFILIKWPSLSVQITGAIWFLVHSASVVRSDSFAAIRSSHIMYLSTNVIKCHLSCILLMAMQFVDGAWHPPVLRRDGVMPLCDPPTPNVDQDAV